MADVLVAVPFVKQETAFYCGPATLQMMLSALGVAAPAGPPTWQDQLWADVQASTGAVRPTGATSTPTSPAYPTQKCEMCEGSWKCWATTPGVLEHIINAGQPVADFTISVHGDEEPATGVLMDTLDANLPGAALIRGWQHWLAVDGYRHGATGATLVAGRNLNGIYVRDPWEQPSIHYITWNDWESDYLKFVPCGDYAGTFVVLRGVRKAQAPQPPQPPTNLRVIDPDEFRRRQLLKLVKKIIPKRDALKYAREAAAELADSTRLRAGFAAVEPSEAVLVQRLDEHDRYYYIVNFTDGNHDSARMIIDAHDGHYSEVSAIRKKGQRLWPYPSRRDSLERLLRTAEKRTSELKYQLRDGSVGEHPIPVWKPCGQSQSPFLPFYQYSVGNSFVYYRFDGLRFDELTEGPA